LAWLEKEECWYRYTQDEEGDKGDEGDVVA
jgi:hypothetical protein